MKRSHVAVGVVGSLISLGAITSFGPEVGASVMVGAALASLNLWILAWSMQRLFAGAGGAYGALAGFKFIALFGLLYLLLDRGWVEPLTLAVGFAALPLGVVLASLLPAPPASLEQSGRTNASSATQSRDLTRVAE